MASDDFIAEFIFQWKIHNFSYCLPWKCIRSPTFVVESMDNTEWCLHIWPKDYTDGIHMEYYLYRISNDRGPERIEIKFELSFKDVNDIQVVKEVMQDTFERDEFKGFAKFVGQDTVYKHRRSEYLPDDTLTACCRMQRVERDIIDPILCDATSVIGVERSSFNWTIENFSSIQNGDKRMMLVHTDSKGKSSFTLILSLMDDPEGEIQIEISHNYMDQPNMTNCEICVMDDSNNIIHSKKDSRYLEGKFWIFPSFITKRKLMADEDTCLIKDELNLKFDISVSLDVTYNEINAYGRYFPEDIGSSSNSDEGCLSSKNSESEHSDTADLRVFEIYLDELKCWYEDGTFSDIILKVGKESFPAHRLILSMKSSKFKEMLVKDSKKKDMELTDVDAETLRELLNFIYIGEVEKLDCDSATKLYVAAKNYNLLGLEQTCLVYLIENIEVSTAWNILKFGGEHDVDELKTLAKDFIIDNATEMIHSHEWKEFATDNIKLALETIQEMYLKQTEEKF